MAIGSLNHMEFGSLNHMEFECLNHEWRSRCAGDEAASGPVHGCHAMPPAPGVISSGAALTPASRTPSPNARRRCAMCRRMAKPTRSSARLTQRSWTCFHACPHPGPLARRRHLCRR
eukprot:364100-Chlamydomonas_euryale.AAC.64